MQSKSILLSLAGLGIGFLLGFLVANSINRVEIEKLRADRVSSNVADESVAASADLTSDEIHSKIAEADANPANSSYQKNLGLALYKYGSLKNDSEIISEAARLLERAARLSPSDQDIRIGLGNAWFDIGYLNKDNESLEKARGQYERALAQSPNDAGLLTDLGMTYFLEEPPNDVKAIYSFKQALAKDPKNEKALQFIIQSLTRTRNKTEALNYLQKLRSEYPSDKSIDGLEVQINSIKEQGVK